jgi:GTP-binding protein EngB required for normal cell division
MSNEQAPRSPRPGFGPVKKPRIALMGEFSAGKSTLSNLLIGGDALPVQVTATQLPPVWISAGDREPFLVDVNEKPRPINLDDLSDIDVHNTKYIRFFRNVDILNLCDLIDTPGISDPNMSSEVWERIIPYMDVVLWCTHATQAWRQSEAAVWSEMPKKLKEKSVLLLTRMDKVIGERDRARVVARVKKETQGEFSAIFPVSLTDALAAGEDRDAWVASGAENFTQHLVDLLITIRNAERPLRREPETRQPANTGEGLKVEGVRPVRNDPVVPRRVAARTNAQRPGQPGQEAPSAPA